MVSKVFSVAAMAAALSSNAIAATDCTGLSSDQCKKVVREIYDQSFGGIPDSFSVYEQACSRQDGFACGIYARYISLAMVPGKTDYSAIFPASMAQKVAEQCEAVGEAYACIAAGLSKAFSMSAQSDEKAAMKYFKRACELGTAQGCTWVGIGLASDKAYSEAAKYFAIACEKGNEGGCSRQAVMLRDGLGVKKNPARASELLAKACERSVGEACFELAVQNSKSTKSPARTREYLEKACTFRVGRSCAELAGAFEKGIGVKKSTEKAREFYAKACVFGYKDACKIQERVIASEQAAQKKTEARTNALYCKCVATKKFLEGEQEEEEAVGRRTGYVNKVKLHSIGVALVRIDRFFAINRGPASDDACTTKYSIDAHESCIYGLAAAEQKRRGLE